MWEKGSGERVCGERVCEKEKAMCIKDSKLARCQSSFTIFSPDGRPKKLNVDFNWTLLYLSGMAGKALIYIAVFI